MVGEIVVAADKALADSTNKLESACVAAQAGRIGDAILAGGGLYDSHSRG
jgi:hypothetical protein